ncbi:MAG: hydrogenase expression/formation C-terminal domain-containing protein [Sideroxyarcus sp.]|nr:hydrogenase expression/formation C-terminal domain-containing protein [Sideroxyarcus sp.]
MTSEQTDQIIFRHYQSNPPEPESDDATRCGSDARMHPVFRLPRSKQCVYDDQCASAQSILYEIEECATRFAETGMEAMIDLHCLHAMPEERGILGILLGLGEVTAIVEAPCNAEVHQTSIPCVWLVRHRNDDEEIIGERIEIAKVPDVIAGDRNAVMPKLEALRSARQLFM